MTLTSRHPAVSLRRSLAVLAGLALTLALLPLSSAVAQDPPEQQDPPARSIDLACPEGEVPPTTFPDQSPTFQRHIDCIIAYEIAVGRADGTYGPTASITRGQMATFVRNLLEEAGVEVDPEATVDYTDIAGTTHEGSIRAISNTDPVIAQGFGDGTFRPSEFVRRDQMATFLANAHEVITEESWEVVETAFTDIEGNVHANNIARLAGTGITVGTTAETYAPRMNITRGQMAAFFARHIDILIELGYIQTRFPVFTGLAIDPAEAANFVDDDHDFTVTAVDQTGDAFDLEAAVYVEVYSLQETEDDPPAEAWELDNPSAAEERTADLADGAAEFSYTRDAEQSDAIVACLLPDDGNGDNGNGDNGNGDNGNVETLAQHEAVCVVTDDGTLEDDLSNLDDELFATAGFKDWVDEDASVTVQLNWQNELDDANGPRYGNVDDFAASEHPDDGSGSVELRWNVEAGILGVSGSTLVTSEVPGDGSVAGTDFHIHSGAIDENGPIAVALPPPTLVEDGDFGVPTDEEPRGVFEYELEGSSIPAPGVVAALGAADGEFVDYYLNVHTVDNPAGEVRGQLADEDSDGGLSLLPPVYKLLDADIEAPVSEVGLEFDIPVEAGTGLGDEADDFTVTVNEDEVNVSDASVVGGVVVLGVADDDDEPITLEDGDVVTATIGDDAAAAILGDDADRGDDATESVRTRAFELVGEDGDGNGNGAGA